MGITIDGPAEEVSAAIDKWRAAHALSHETWSDVQETMRRGDRLTLAQETATRLALQHTTWGMEEVARETSKTPTSKSPPAA